MPKSDFTDNERMNKNVTSLKDFGEYAAASAKMVDPYRRIDENHLGLNLRRGGAFNPGSVPPSRASRRAASRSTKALKASRISADFSFNPV